MVSWLDKASSEVANTYKIAKTSYEASARSLSVSLPLSQEEGRKGDRVISYLDELVPAARHDHGVLGVGAEADARNPLGVALVGDGELAVTEGVPQLDGAVARAGDDLSVVGGERDGQDIVGVADESAGGGASGELPQTKGLVPRGGQGVGTVGGDDL